MHRRFPHRTSIILLALTVGLFISIPALPTFAKNVVRGKIRTPVIVVRPGETHRVTIDMPDSTGRAARLEFVLTNLSSPQISHPFGAQINGPMAAGASGCYGAVTRTVLNGLAWKWEATQHFRYNTSPPLVTLTDHAETATTANLWSFHHKTYSSAYLPGPTAHVVDNGYFTNPVPYLSNEYGSIDMTMDSAGSCRGSASSGTWG